MRRSALLLGMAQLALAAVAPVAAQSPAREVYTRAELDAVGVHRLSELIEWVSGWSGTVEGVSWGASLDGLPSGALARVALPDVALLVDGQRVAVDAHGAWLPGSAPIVAQQIDSVVVTRAPGLVGGTVVARGAIHVHTRPVPTGLSGLIWYRNGAETGDPGPYLWTARATPNVDRTGPDAVGLVAYGGRRWDAELSLRYIRQDVSDPRLRSIHGAGHPAFVYTRGPALRAGVDAAGGRHELLISRIEQLGSAYFADAGRLTHASVVSTHLGATGTGGVADGLRWSYRLTHSRLSSGHGAGHEVATGRDLSHASLEWRAPAGAWDAVATIGVDRWRLDRDPSMGGASRHTRGGLLVGAERLSPDGTGHRLAASLARVGERFADRVTASSEWWIGEGRRLVLAGSSVRALPEEPHRSDAWVFPGADGSNPPDLRLIRGEVGLTQRVGQRLTVRGGGVLLAVRTGESAGQGGAGDDPSPPRYRGTRMGARLGLAFGDSVLRGRVDYQSLGSVAASEELERAAAAVPAHTVRASVAYSLAPTFRLAATARFRSASRWGSPLSPLGDPRELGPATRLDLSAEKWLWRRRVRAQFVVRNALDATEILHPAGSNLGLRYFVGASIDLPSGR